MKKHLLVCEEHVRTNYVHLQRYITEEISNTNVQLDDFSKQI